MLYCPYSEGTLKDPDVRVITAATARIDQTADRERLEHTIAELKLRLLILDPFVRLHRIDENTSGEVAPLLAYLRTLQCQHQLGVLVVYHARKSVGRMRAAEALRGSSEFHAWGDSNLYMRRSGDELNLTVEHRAAPSPQTIGLLRWGLFDHELFVEHGEKRFGPYAPVGCPIPLHHYRTYKKTRTQARADRIEALAAQIQVPRSALKRFPGVSPAPNPRDTPPRRLPIRSVSRTDVPDGARRQARDRRLPRHAACEPAACEARGDS